MIKKSMKWKTEKRKKKINETKCSFFEKISGIDKPLAKVLRKKEKRTQIANIWNF